MWGSFTLVGTLAYGSGRRRAIETKCGARLAEITFVDNFLRIDMEVKSLLPARCAATTLVNRTLSTLPCKQPYPIRHVLIKLYDYEQYRASPLTFTYLHFVETSQRTFIYFTYQARN